MWFCNKKEYDCDIRLDGKTVVITGGNAGIGKETVKDLYKRGARIIMVSRDQTKSKQAIEEIKSEVKQLHDQHDICIKYLDLTDLSTVQICADEILKNEKLIHLLINNAGILGHHQLLSKDDFEIHFACNYLGHFLFTLLLLPRMINSGPARIVHVASIIHKCPVLTSQFEINQVRNAKKGIKQFKAYCQSKLATVLFSVELSRRLKEASIDNVTVHSLHPGLIATDIGRNFDSCFWGLDWTWFKLNNWFLLTPKQGARTTLFCALDKKLSEQSGLFYSNCSECSMNRLVNNEEITKNLWDRSIEMVKLKNFDPFTPDIMTTKL